MNLEIEHRDTEIQRIYLVSEQRIRKICVFVSLC